MRRQKGFSMILAAVWLVIIMVAIKTAYALVPVYWENRMLGTVLDGIQESDLVEDKTTVGELKKIIRKSLTTSNITIPQDQFTVQRNAEGRLEVDWPYEVRTNWFGNVDMVVSFKQYKEF